MNSAKATTFRAQDVKHTRRICHTKAETNEAVRWTEELKAEGRLLNSSVQTRRRGSVVVEVTWIDMP